VNRKFFLVMSLLVLASLALAACGPKAVVQTEGLEEQDFEPISCCP
jgi:hypothetical protein